MGLRNSNSKGLGLIEVMIAMVVGLLVIAGTVSLAKVARRQQLSITNNFDFDNLKRNIQRLVNSSGTCRGLFFESSGNSSLQFDVGSDNQVQLKLGNVVLAARDVSLGSGLMITSVILRKVDGSTVDATSIAGSSIVRVQLIITAKRNAESVGPSEVSNIENPFVFSIQINNGTHLIESCSDGVIDPGISGTGVSCKSGGTFSFKDFGFDNDFGITCRNGAISAACLNDDVDGLSSGPHPHNYYCEKHSAPIPGQILCGSGDKTVRYSSYGSSNDFALTCRAGRISGWCSPARANGVGRGTSHGSHHCENGLAPDPADPDKVICDFDGTYMYEDEGYSQFAVSCRNGKLVGLCFGDQISNLSNGFNPGYTCEN